MRDFRGNSPAQAKPAKGPRAGTAAELDALLPALFDRAFKGEL